jgi:long-subunit fatty acid transport protein
MIVRHVALCALALAFMLGVAPTVLAGGMEVTENGAPILGRAGAFTARGDHPMAIHYNPGALTRLKGKNIYWGTNLVNLDFTFTRSGLEEQGLLTPEGPYASATVKNEPHTFVGPSLAAVYGGGAWAVGAALYGPGAVGNRTFDEEGPQRFMLTEAETLLAFATVSGAMELSKSLSVGLSLQMVTMPQAKFGIDVDGGIKITESMPSYHGENANSSPDEPNPNITHTELEVSDLSGFTAIAGIHATLSPAWEIGLASRLLPVEIDAAGTMTLSAGAGLPKDEGLQSLMDNGKVAVVTSNCADWEDDCADDYGATLKFTLPPWVRLGARYIGRDAEGDETFDVEVDLVYERWSVLEEYRIGFNGKLKAFNRLEELDDVVIPKRWNDTFAIRMGSNFTPLGSWLVFRAGAHFETAAVPEETTNIDFLGFDRLGGSLGAGVALGPLTVDVAYQLVYQPDREVTNSEVIIQRPLDPDVDLPIATGNGTYESTFHTIGLSLGYSWGAPDETLDEDEDEDE